MRSQNVVHRQPRRMPVLLAFVLATGVFGMVPALAASQNELLVSLAFDGQSFTADPLDSLTGITPDHTPGADLRGDNGVVRTYDLVGYRVDYNVNEEGQTGATIDLQLPPNMTWITDAATIDAVFPEGMYPGCLVGSVFTSSGLAAAHGVVGTKDILTCIVGDENAEGSNGTIYPVAQLLADTDEQIKTLSASLDTTEQPCAGNPICAGSVDVQSSGAPSANFKTGLDVVDTDGLVIGREPNEFYEMQRGGVDGWVSLYTIEFRTVGNSILGSEPIDDSYPISFYNHFWDFPSTTVFATDDGTPTGVSMLEDGRNVCGTYDGRDAYPTTAPGVWTCSQASSSSQTVALGLTGYDTKSFTANANGSPNTSMYSVAQVALWTPSADLETRVPNQISSTISQSATPPTGTLQADPILFSGSTTVVAETDLADNDASSLFSLVVTQPGSRELNSWIRFMDGPFQAREYLDNKFTGEMLFSVDERDGSVGGIGGFDAINTCASNGVTWTNAYTREGWCGEQEVSRGAVVTLTTVAAGFVRNGPSVFDSIHQCVALDNSHMSLVALPAAFEVNVVEGVHPGTGVALPNDNDSNRATSWVEAQTVGGSTSSPNQGPLAHVFAGTRSSQYVHHYTTGSASNNDIPASALVVEFATSRNPVRQLDDPVAVTTPLSVAQHGVTCNNDDAVGSNWVDSTDIAAVNSAFDPDGDGLFQGIDRIRLRMLETYDLTLPAGEAGATVHIELNLQARVHQDPVIDTAGQELFALVGRATGEWDPATENAPTATSCWTGEPQWGGNTTTTTGWCNLPYTEDSNLSPMPGGGAIFYDNSAEELLTGSGWAAVAHADKVFIVEANIALNKVNLDGLTDIADNGGEVIFGLSVSTIGATTDELNDVMLIDDLPAGYSFVGFNDDADGQCASLGDSITCDFGDHVGGWSDYVEIVVEVRDVEADTKITNAATVSANRADGSPLEATSEAFSRTPSSYDEIAIIKSTNTIEGDCVTYPEVAVDAPLAPEPADWADRCELTDFETGELLFDLLFTNAGNVTATGITFVDVFPHTDDEAEAPSATGVIGDGRAPESNLAEGNTLTYVGFTGSDVTSVWVSADAPSGISRDPVESLTATTWCDGLSGAVVNPGNTGSGACPTASDTVTAIYASMVDAGVGETISGTLELTSAGHECGDIWTNSFGARHERTLLPVRSNDVSIMVSCEFRIGNVVWVDANADGVQDALESVVPGVSVNLLDRDGEPVLDDGGLAITTVTNAAGEYFFDVAAGEYVIEFDLETLPVNFVPTLQNSGGDDALDSDADWQTGRTVVIEVSDVAGFVDTDDDGVLDDYSHDLGITPVTRIGDVVWADANDDGLQDVGEAPVSGVTVNLLDGDGTPVLDADGVPVTAVTNETGQYFFDVAPGGYIIEFDPATLPPETQFTSQEAGADDGLDSNADPVTGWTASFVIDPLVLTDTDGDGIVDDYTHDAGISVVVEVTVVVEIGDFIWLDADGDGVQDPGELPVAGVIVELLDADGNPVLGDEGDPVTTLSNAAGGYGFTVTPGDYQTQFTLPAGHVPTASDAGSDDAVDSDADAFSQIPTFTVEPGMDDPTLDMGLVKVQVISGVVWNDLDGDGVIDVDETTRPGVLVELFDEAGAPILDAAGNPVTATTDADGSYGFEVPPGQYRLQFTAPDGTFLTPGTGADNDAGVDGLTSVIAVVAGVDVTNIDAGLGVSDLTPSTMAITGFNTAVPLLIAFMLMSMGFGLVFFARRRRPAGVNS